MSAAHESMVPFMDQEGDSPGSYEANSVDQLEIIWGDGFMSPGGTEEVGRIVAGSGITGADVLDVGCGTGGAALVLAVGHDARSVTGVDIEPFVIGRATALAAAQGQQQRVRFLAIEPGRLPFESESFDVVFSKDAIIHVQDKEALYAEMYRVLRPGGRLCVGDWLRGVGDELDAQVQAFVTLSDEGFFMQTLADLSILASKLGFENVEVDDRGSWYHARAQEELARLDGDLREVLLTRLGQKGYDRTVEFWQALVVATQSRVLSPGHLRAQKAR